MTLTEQNKATVSRFNKEFIEQGNMSTFNEIISTEFQNHSAPPGVPKGPEGVLFFFNNFLKSSFPTLSVDIIDQVAESDKVTTRKIIKGKHEAAFMGIPPTGKEVLMEVIDIIRLRDGKFVEHWNVADWQHIISQITAD
jgi:predicted ester cyclase